MGGALAVGIEYSRYGRVTSTFTGLNVFISNVLHSRHGEFSQNMQENDTNYMKMDKLYGR